MKFPDLATQIDVFALTKQAIYGDYVSNYMKIDMKKEWIDENNVYLTQIIDDESRIAYIESWRRKSYLS